MQNPKKQREIKFRVWDKKEKKWIDDSDIAINKSGLLFIRYQGQTDFSPISLTKSANYEIVFYAGLKDSNEVEIYEGDIVRCLNEEMEGWFPGTKEKVIVEFRNGVFYPFEIVHGENVEVIGNIYENN